VSSKSSCFRVEPPISDHKKLPTGENEISGLKVEIMVESFPTKKEDRKDQSEKSADHRDTWMFTLWKNAPSSRPPKNLRVDVVTSAILKTPLKNLRVDVVTELSRRERWTERPQDCISVSIRFCITPFRSISKLY